MSGMFDSCPLEELDLSNFNSSSNTYVMKMFMDCFSLEYLNLKGFKTDKIQNFKKVKSENILKTKYKKSKTKKIKTIKVKSSNIDKNNINNISNKKSKLKKNNKSLKSKSNQLNKTKKNLIKTSKLNDIILLLKRNKALRKPYFIYIILCDGDKLYTGITTDVDRRFKEHKDISDNRKEAKYTKLNKPLKVLKYFKVKNRSIATSLEHKIKKLSKLDKVKLCKVGEI